MIVCLLVFLVFLVFMLGRIQWVFIQQNKLINDTDIKEYQPIDTRYKSFEYMVMHFWIWDVDKFKLDK